MSFFSDEKLQITFYAETIEHIFSRIHFVISQSWSIVSVTHVRGKVGRLRRTIKISCKGERDNMVFAFTFRLGTRERERGNLKKWKGWNNLAIPTLKQKRREGGKSVCVTYEKKESEGSAVNDEGNDDRPASWAKIWSFATIICFFVIFVRNIYLGLSLVCFFFYLGKFVNRSRTFER